MSLPKEPRQKMINVMYLVLTALLALNVSSEVLHAFETINESLEYSNDVIRDDNDKVGQAFQSLMADNKTKVKATEWYAKAVKVQSMSDDVFNAIEAMKEELKKEASGGKYDRKKKDTLYSISDLEAGTRLFVEGTPTKKEKGSILYQMLVDYKANIVNVSPEIKNHFPSSSLPLNLETKKLKKGISEAARKKEWAFAFFHMTPAVAGITILTNFQTNVRTIESKLLTYCLDQVGNVKVIFDAYLPIVSTSASYLLPGDKLEIDAGLGAFSSQQKPIISIDGVAMPLGAGGLARYVTEVRSPGSYQKKVRVTYVNQTTGQTETKEVPVKYTVGSPTGINISAEQTKVLYIGLDNPIAVTGIGDEKITLRMDNGATFAKTGPGRFSVQVRRPGIVNVTVAADGKSTTTEFRCLSVPSPIAFVGRSKGGRMPANEFRAQTNLRAVLENFIFQGVKYEVIGYKMYATGPNFPQLAMKENRGATFSQEIQTQIIPKCVAGTSVTFDEIKVSGPGGTVTLPPMAFILF